MNIKRIRIAWLCLLGLLVLWLLWRLIVPLGSFSYSTDFSKENYFIGKLSPQERVIYSNQGVALKAEPIYFSLFTPRRFSRAILQIDFSNPPKLLEAGLRRDKTIWNFDLKPVYSEVLEKLSQEKNSLEFGNTLLWQKNKKYESINNFLSDLPSSTNIISYRYPLPNNFQINEAALFEKSRDYYLGLRGAYQFYTYSNGQPIELSFYLKDRNEIVKPTINEINIYQGQELIFSKAIPENKTDRAQKLDLKTNKLNKGVYRVEFKADDDLITERLSTKQSKISFIGSLWLVEAAISPIKIYSDSSLLTAQTNNPAGLQKIIIDGKPLDLNETYRQFVFPTNDTTRRLKEIVIGKKDLIIAGDGVWAFSKETLFNPSLKTLTAQSDINNLGVEYLIAQYSNVEKLDNNLYRATLEFDLSGAYREKNKYSFMLSAPTAQLSDNPIIIKSISFKLSGLNLFEAIESLWP